jgi:hypothetical protein
MQDGPYIEQPRSHYDTAVTYYDSVCGRYLTIQMPYDTGCQHLGGVTVLLGGSVLTRYRVVSRAGWRRIVVLVAQGGRVSHLFDFDDRLDPAPVDEVIGL